MPDYNKGMHDTTPEKTQQRVQARLTAEKDEEHPEKALHTLGRLKIEYVPIDSVYPNTYNPNVQTEEDYQLLLNSIREDGFTMAILINQDNEIVDGEHRWRAAKELGMDTIPIIKAKMNEVQQRISTVRHNRARGVHDVELEASVYADIQLLGTLDIAAESLNMDLSEIEALIEMLPAPELFAGDEFGKAWEPSDLGNDEADLIDAEMLTTEGFITADTFNNPMLRAMTQKAIDTYRRLDDLTQATDNPDVRLKLRRASDKIFHKMNLLFSGDQAKLVKDILGENPAEKLKELVMAEMSDEEMAAIKERYDESVQEFIYRGNELITELE